MNGYPCEGETPTAAEVAAQLQRVLASATFANAPILSRFLRYVVEHSLPDQACPLKEYALGVEVFGRGADFDPRIDTIVRTHARRLRAKLEEYYRGDGARDPIVIEVPKGHYVPLLARPPPPPMFGQAYDYDPAFDVWGLHAWVWRYNPSGMFAAWNPNVSCEHGVPQS